MAEAEIGDNLAGLLNAVLNQRYDQIREALDTIMANQAEFDAKVEALRAAVQAETEQVAEWIANHPNIDTSALDTMVANIENIFNNPDAAPEPPAPEEPPTEEPTEPAP